MAPTVAPYGSWRSPITTDLIVSENIGLSEVRLDGEDIYWLEMRPGEKGRYVLVRCDGDGVTDDVVPAEYNVRTRVHEYGGAAYAVNEGVVAFCNFADQKLYLQQPDTAPQSLTPDGMRYADISFDKNRNRLIAVREDHTTDGAEAVNTIVAIDVESGGGGEVLASGYDFYSTPRLNSAGNRLSWLAWNHPDMPWTTTELWVADVENDGALSNARCVAGGEEESIFQPTWSPDGRLYFVSDRSNWWNLYRWDGDKSTAIAPLPAEFGQPSWVFGMSTYGFVSADEIVASYTQNGAWHLANINLEYDKLATYDLPYSSVTSVQANSEDAIFIGGSAAASAAIVRMDLATMDTEPSSCFDRRGRQRLSLYARSHRVPVTPWNQRLRHLLPAAQC